MLVTVTSSGTLAAVVSIDDSQKEGPRFESTNLLGISVKSGCSRVGYSKLAKGVSALLSLQ